MFLLNFLIVGLTIIHILLHVTKRAPVLIRSLRWGVAILFTYQWGIGGYVQYPVLANICGIAIITFWIMVVCYYSQQFIRKYSTPKRERL